MRFEEIEHRLCRRIQVRIEIYKEPVMRGHDISRKGFVEPTLEERNTGIVDRWDGTLRRKVPLLSAEIPRFRETLEAIESVQLASGIAQQTGPDSYGPAAIDSEFKVQDFAIANLLRRDSENLFS